jgi:hypothetical protein
MFCMSNQSYLSLWCTDFPESSILERLGAFLSTAPFSATKPGFTYLAIRAVDAAEAPILEHDLRAMPLDVAGIIELARDHLHNDSSFEVQCHWDLWVFDVATTRWQLKPQAVEIFCHGEDYDHAFWREYGHLGVNFGFEHLFTGHAGLLGIGRVARRFAEGPEEARFLEAMAWPEHLEQYQEKTRENIRRLLHWVGSIEKAVPLERICLWSEGEENFEARLDEILAAP